MPYFKTVIKAGKTIEVHKSYSKRLGDHRPRGNREKPTAEEMEKVNQKNAEIRLRLLLNENFRESDLHLIFTYKKNQRATHAEAKKQIKKLLTDLRKEYRKVGEIMKYVHVTEYESKAIHHHVVLNAWEYGNVMKVIQKLWTYGKVFFVQLEANGQYGDLAAYLIKETSKTFKNTESCHKQRYSCSKNLVRPKAKVTIIKRQRWLPDPKPKKGYYIDKEYTNNGYSEYTGKAFQHYVMVKISDETGGFI